MSRVFRDYAEVNEKLLEGYTVAKVTTGINAEDTGLLMELERVVDNVTLGIDVCFNPDYENEETDLTISNEYVKRVAS